MVSRPDRRGDLGKGVYTGRKATLDRARVKELAKGGMGPAKIARELGMARSSVYRLLAE